MFFRRSRPLDEHSAKWVESALAELDYLFGRDRFLCDPIEPTAEFFPERVRVGNGSFERTVHRVAGLMDVPRDRYRVVIERLSTDLYLEDAAEHWSPSSAAGLYEESANETVIRIDRGESMSLSDLIGTAAHELSHLKLMGDDLINPGRFDNELLTDLTALYHGFGIFLANSPRAFVGQMSYWPETTARRPEYMSLPMFGHALAHQAWHRGETKPAWMRHLRPDARTCVKVSLKWLLRTEDSKYRPRPRVDEIDTTDASR